MRDDYLWDGSGEPDPEVARLERILSRLRSSRPAPELPEDVVSRKYIPWLAAAASLLLVSISVWYFLRQPAAYWQVARLAGAPRIGSRLLQDVGRIAVGQWIETDANSRAKIDVGLIGQVEIEPNTRLQLLKAEVTEHRLSLQRGKMHAKIWAPPRLFFVDTPSATAVDLGCAYSLEVDDTGASWLRVTSGWVLFEWGGRESVVPFGAACFTRPGAGPGTPYYEDSAWALQAALEKLDFANGGPPALAIVLSEARLRDSMTLWHLLSRVETPMRASVFDRLATLVAPPASVTRDGILQLDKNMLATWHDKIDRATW